MKEFIKIMKALSDPNRAKILKMLECKEMCVCEIKAALGLAQPTISKHLKILEEAGLVDRRKDGLWVNYCLPANASSYAEVLLTNLRGWLNTDPEIEALTARLPELDRETICAAERQKPAA